MVHDLDIRIAPLPVVANATLHIKSVKHQWVTISVHDVLGREIAVLFDGMLEAGPRMLPLAMDPLPEGMYFLRIAGSQSAATVAFPVLQ